jgi:hypothetical protein
MFYPFNALFILEKHIAAFSSGRAPIPKKLKLKAVGGSFHASVVKFFSCLFLLKPTLTKIFTIVIQVSLFACKIIAVFVFPHPVVLTSTGTILHERILSSF